MVADPAERALAEELQDWSLPVVARILGISRRYVHRLIAAHKDELPPARFRPVRGKWTRVFVADEIRTLKRHLAVRVGTRSKAGRLTR